MTYLICTQRRQSNKLKGSKKPMPNGEQITRHVAKIPRREFTTSLLHPLPMLLKLPSTANTAAGIRRHHRTAVNLFRKSPSTQSLLGRTCLYELWDSLCFACKLACLLTHSPHGLATSLSARRRRRRWCRCCFHTKSKLLSKEGNHTKNYWFVNEKGGRPGRTVG